MHSQEQQLECPIAPVKSRLAFANQTNLVSYVYKSAAKSNPLHSSFKRSWLVSQSTLVKCSSRHAQSAIHNLSVLCYDILRSNLEYHEIDNVNRVELLTLWPGGTEKLSPTAWPTLWYGSWPMMTTLTCSNGVPFRALYINYIFDIEQFVQIINYYYST